MEPVDIARDALMQALTIAAPILLAGVAIGLLISLFQAVTQIQEQTLTFVPKIFVMFLVAMALLSWIATQMMDYAIEMFSSL